jgi:hypothetical protein
MRWLFLSLALIAVTPAAAHNVDCNNESQPVEFHSGCCGKEDYRALRPNEVRPDGPGYDVFLDGKWREAIQENTNEWLIAQPTGAACWGIWYRQGKKDGATMSWTSHNGNTDMYHFYCLEQPVLF